MSHFYLRTEDAEAVVTAIPPLTRETTRELVHQMSHAVGHDIGPSNHRDHYAGNTVPLAMGRGLGLVDGRLVDLGRPETCYWVNDAGKALLRKVYADIARLRGRKPLKAFFVDYPTYDQFEHTYGQPNGNYMLAETAAQIRQAMVSSDECGSLTYADVRVRRAPELDGAVRDAWQHCVPERGIVYVPGRAVFHGPWINWCERDAARKARADKRDAAAIVLASQQGAL